MTLNVGQIQDWVYDNYQAAYVIGTGILTLAAFAAMPEHLRNAKAFAGGYLAITALGALMEPCVDVESSVYGQVLSRGTDAEMKIALTFDDGPNPVNTPHVLDVLKEEGVKATFFCVGQQALNYPKLVKRIFDEGHLVGSHTFSHRNLLGCTPEESYKEIAFGIMAVSSVLNAPVTYFRPPYGMRWPWTMQQSEAMGQTAVLWSNCPRDWQLPGADVIAGRVIKKAGPGHIVLLHDGGGDRLQTIYALPEIIRTLRARGFSFVRADELSPCRQLPVSRQ